MDCAIRTDDAMVSRHHAPVYWAGGGYVLEDLSSANGVYFQEQRVQSHTFKHGDAVRCGSLWLRFVDAGAGSVEPAGPPPSSGGAPMMQHPGMGAIAPAGPTGHIDRPSVPDLPPAAGPSEADVEIRVLRRRVEQLQTELRVYRANKFSQETARRMEDLENDMSMLEIDRNTIRAKLESLEQQMTTEAGSVKVQRAVEIAAMTAETSSSLNDMLSSLRIEVMAAEGEFDQYAQTIPRASFELIRQSLKEAAGRCDEARNLLRKLREVAE